MIQHKVCNKISAKPFWMVLGINFLTVSLCISIAVSACAANILESLGADFVAHFDREVAIDEPSGLSFEKYGGPTLVSGGISGKALSLLPGQYLAVNTAGIVNQSEGTITMWVRPHGLSDSTASHTFLSFKWLSPKPAYFVLSRGWFEPAGIGSTYFIGNNQEFASMTRQIYYNPGKWIQLTCVWKTGNAGFSKLYVNGYLVYKRNPAVDGKPPWLPYTPDGNLFIGTDKGTLDAKNRWADSDIDEMAIFKRALTDAEVLQMYNSIGKPAADTPIKDGDGTILESRAIFDEGRSWMTDTGAAQTISRIKQAGFNVYVPCVWHGTGTRFPSSLAIREYKPVFAVDPLKRVIDIAHKNGIEVHAWFTVALRMRDFYTDFYGIGTPSKAFDVHRPAFRDFIVNLIVDTAERYDLDGIVLDFIRTMGHCTCTYCQNVYNRQFGRNLLDDIASSPAGGPLEPHLQQWHDQAVAAIVSEVSRRVKTVKSNGIVSAYGNPNDGRPHWEGRELIPWANSDQLDAVFSGTYATVPDYEAQNYAASILNKPQKLVVMPANYVIDAKGIPVSRAVSAMSTIISTLQQRLPLQGKAIYDYSFLTDAQILALSQGPFMKTARPGWRAIGKELSLKPTGLRIIFQ